jgi:hypothetical protein
VKLGQRQDGLRLPRPGLTEILTGQRVEIALERLAVFLKEDANQRGAALGTSDPFDGRPRVRLTRGLCELSLCQKVHGRIDGRRLRT